MTDFHIVSNNSAAGSLRHMIKEKGQVGEEVFHADDAFAVGPLHDGFARARFWEEMMSTAYTQHDINLRRADTKTLPLSDRFAPWVKMRQAIKQMAPDRILIWAAGSASDYVFLRMACRKLADLGISLFHIAVPPKDGYYSVTMHPPEELAPMIMYARHLTQVECDALALEFDHIAARPELLRECDENGQLRFGQLSDHDDLLLTAIGYAWQHAPRAIGIAMSNSDLRNCPGDLEIAARLRHLIETGVVEEEYLAEPKSWDNWYVRLSK